MSEHENALSSPSGWWIQLLATVVQQFPRSISPARGKYLNEHPSEVGKLLSRIFTPMFVTPEEQLEVAKQRNVEGGWGFTDADFIALGRPPTWPEGELCAVVLEVCLTTVGQTFDEAWHFAKSVQPESRRWDELKSDTKGLRLLSGIQHRRGLRWQSIDLAANWDKKDGIRPRDVRDPKKSPHCAILWAASYFPQWVQAMDGLNVPYVWISGYEVRVSGNPQWSLAPHLSWDRDGRKVRLNAADAGDRSQRWAVPEFRE